MDEIEIVHGIGKLVEDEHALERAHAGSPPSDEDVAYLRVGSSRGISSKSPRFTDVGNGNHHPSRLL